MYVTYMYVLELICVATVASCDTLVPKLIRFFLQNFTLFYMKKQEIGTLALNLVLFKCHSVYVCMYAYT